MRLLLSLAVERELKMHQMDVCTAFLNGQLKEEIFMSLPDGFEKGKMVYGLKQASRVWNERFHKFVVNIDFKQSGFDQCLYIRGRGDMAVFLLLYVDDLILLGKSTRNQCDQDADFE